jgi:glycosyltransferase involved in cell wall biosynthesis
MYRKTFCKKQQGETQRMIRFSLVVATCGRTTEVKTLLSSVLCQRRHDIEVILVDQNADDRLLPVIEEVQGGLTIRHLRTENRNASAARNLGLDAAQGEIVAFPDDDCWYPDHLLDGVDQWFKTSPQHSVLAVGAIDDEGIPSGNRWIQDSCEIKPWNSLRTTFCSSLFLSAVEESRSVRFDPMLARGEETDFILRLLDTGLRGRFDRSLFVRHPRRDMMSGTVSRKRAVSYGAGMGRLVRRHSLIVLWTALVAYDLMRAGLVVLRGRPGDAVFCFAHATGLFKGFVLPEGSYD